LTDILFKVLRNRERIVELGIGVSTEWLHTAEQLDTNKTIKFVFLGRYERRKGIEELSAVLKELIEEDKYQFEFEFIGPIPEDKRLKYSNIQYHGLIREQSKIQTILKKSDVLVCPSYSEGMPTVILEAMASGCAVIATDVGAVNEEVSKENGWLIQPANKNELKEVIISACNIESSKLLLKKKKSIEKVKEIFLWSVIVNKHIEAFSKIIG
jgi:glycosyltransferase involved in cell wall biosynthesis